ncbi:MAG: STAS domain-containing protein [Planctomycetota bacterium]
MSIEMTHTHREDGINLMTLVGDLDVESVTAFNFDAKFAAAVAARHEPTIVDMSGVKQISSLGMGALVGNATSLKRRGTGMVLMGCSPMVTEALRIAGIDKLIPLVDNEDQAIGALRAMSTE